MKNSITHIYDIKCPSCNHKYSYDFKIEPTKKYSDKKVRNENLYEFLTYLVCKNPLCNYDIEIKGDINMQSPNNIDSIRIISIK